MVMVSSTVTSPDRSQSPVQGGGEGDDVGEGVGVAVGDGVLIRQMPSSPHMAPTPTPTTTEPASRNGGGQVSESGGVPYTLGLALWLPLLRRLGVRSKT